jgi:hypothetical protein
VQEFAQLLLERPHLDLQELDIKGSAGSAGWQGPTTEELQQLLEHTRNLHVLRLRSCSRLQTLPNSLGGLRSLTTLAVKNCKSLADLPASLPPALQRLDLQNCSELTGLPTSVGSLCSLHTIDLQGCKVLDTVDSLQHCSSLQQVVFNENDKLEQLVDKQSLWDCSNLQGKGLRDGLRQIASQVSSHKAMIALVARQDQLLTTLERLSWLAVLLATATFIGFLQPPSGTTTEQSGGEPTIKKNMPHANQAFFLLDTTSFLMSLAALVVIVISSMPRIRGDNEQREAGRFWCLVFCAWGLLYIAILAGAGAFLASAFAVYGPADEKHGLYGLAAVGAVVLVLGGLSLSWRLVRIFPGCAAWADGVADICREDLPLYYVCPPSCLTNMLVFVTCADVKFGSCTLRGRFHSNVGEKIGRCLDHLAMIWRSVLGTCCCVPKSFFEKHQP